MTTGTDLVAVAEQHLGMPYWNRDNSRFGPFHADCSGWWVMLLRLLAIFIPGDVALNSEGLLVWGRNAGLEIPLEHAYQIPGASVSRWGTGDFGHIGGVKDPNTSLETPVYPGHCSGERNLTVASGRDWDHAHLWPSVDYTGNGAHVDLVALAASIASATRLVLHFGDVHPVAVTWLQVMLNRTRRTPLVVDGVYGIATLNALLAWENNVTQFLHMAPTAFPHSGTIDASVWGWLRLSAKI